MVSRLSFFSVLSSLIAVEASAAQVDPPLVDNPKLYKHLTDAPKEVVNFNPEPFTGLVEDAGGGVWAVNPYDSTVVYFSSASILGLSGGATAPVAPARTVRTGLNPVSIALRQTPNGDELLVVCSGTHAMFVHNAVTGKIVDVTMLETTGSNGGGLVSEGADIVVDPDLDAAFVSCPDSSAVLKIDLATRAVVHTTYLDVGRRPGPLALNRGSFSDPNDNLVYVAMTVTGNGTTGRVRIDQVDVVQQAVDALGVPLPDHDIYEINGVTGAAQPRATGMGSLLFDIDVNPLDAALWVLSQESLNALDALAGAGVPMSFDEPTLRGRFAINQLKRVGSSSSTTDLDLRTWDMNDAYAASSSINQPRSVAFTRSGPDIGTGFIASPFVDRIIRVKPNGERSSVDEWLTLDSASNCFDLHMLQGSTPRLLALCLGTMRVSVFDPVTRNELGALDLGQDPTLAQVRRGRDTFYNGAHSADSRFSCATCHPRGMSDQLGWMLSGTPGHPEPGMIGFVQKDMMLTQTLFGIADTYPHHWRGERSLKDFEKAFPGLLGATESGVNAAPTDQEMDDLIVFFQSLQPHANPVESPLRQLDDGRRSRLPVGLVKYEGQGNTPTTDTWNAAIANASPIAGQETFLDPNIEAFAGLSCAECHSPESGTNANFSVENNTSISRANILEVPHLRQLNVRGLNEFIVPGPPPAGVFNVNGFGVTHDGVGESFAEPGASVFRFLFETAPFKVGMSEAERLDVFRFVDQFDQGISPAAHWATTLTQLSTESEFDLARAVLERGRESGWNDIVAIVYAPGGATPFRLASTPWGTQFEGETGNLYGWDLLIDTYVKNGLIDVVLMGAPLGNGRRVGIDWDRDGTRNGDEPATSTSHSWTQAYGAGQGLPLRILPGGGLDHATARMGKFHVRFSRPSIYEVEYDHPSLPAPLVFESVRGGVAPSPTDYVVEDTFVLPHDLPGGANGTPEPFDVTIRATAWGSTSPVSFSLNRFDFTPDAAVDHMGEQVTFEFTHVESTVPVTPNLPFIGGFESFAVQVRVKENERDANGEFVDAENVAVFATIEVENTDPLVAGDYEWRRVDTKGPAFSSPLAKDVLIDTGNPNAPFPYPFVDHLLVSPVITAADDGTALLQFRIQDVASVLPAGADVRVTIQGVVRRTGTAANGDPTFSAASFREFTLLSLEGAAEAVIAR